MKHAQTNAPKASSTHAEKEPKNKDLQSNAHSRDDLVKLTAYFFYEAREGAHGSDLDDWLRAESHIDRLISQNLPPDLPNEAITRAGLND